MRKTLLISMMLFLNVVNTYALQVRAISDNKTVLIKVAAKEQSRIFVKNDRIAVVRGIDGAYDLKKDDKLGDIYIQPTAYFQHKVFNLFITTEQGHTFTLLASPLDVPAETIEIKLLSPSISWASRWEKNSPYSQTLINLITAMINHSDPDGYAIINIGKVKPKKFTNCLTMQLVTLYRGNHLQGEVWRIKNESRDSVYIYPRDFYQSNVLAATLIDERLNSKEETLLYRVVNYDE